MPAAFLPSPARAVWHLGPLPVRAYALCMVGGIVLGVWLAIDLAPHLFGLRVNQWVMALMFAGALGYLYLARGRRAGAAGPARPARLALPHVRRFSTRAERASMHR
jgi:hypothetical protein